MKLEIDRRLWGRRVLGAAAALLIALPAGCRSVPEGPADAAEAVDAGDTVTIAEVASRFGFDRFEVDGRRILLQGKPGMLEMEAESRRATFNGVVFWLSAPPVREGFRWRMLQSDVAQMIKPLVVPPKVVKAEGNPIVVLDPGHGGEDSGATNRVYGIQEKDVALALASAVGERLRQKGVDARLTRSEDRTLDLQARCDYAQKVKADVFVSIHLNAAGNTGSSGVEVHILPPAGHPGTADRKGSRKNLTSYPGNLHDGASLVLGHALQASLVKYTGAEDRGVRRSRFHVVKYASCPAALVECGFLSNRAEAKKLRDPAYRERIVCALSEGILAYLEAVRQARVAPSTTSPWSPP